jgi:predicted secreted Zn-dependent protease
LRTVFILLVLGLGQSSLAEKSTRTEYYSISGTTGIELLNEMSAKGPQGYSGYTRHEYSYDYGTRMINGRCRVSRMSMDMDITYTMPRWENESSANTELQGRWNDWYRLLEQHEYGHSAFAESGYNDILSEWRRIGGSDNCQDIRSQVEQVYNSIRARVNQQNAEYDQLTNHGQSQGVSSESLAGNEGMPSLPDFGIDSSSGNYWWLVFAVLIGLLFFVRKS